MSATESFSMQVVWYAILLQTQPAFKQIPSSKPTTKRYDGFPFSVFSEWAINRVSSLSLVPILHICCANYEWCLPFLLKLFF